MIRVGIVTISDRSARGEREDTSGPALQSLVIEQRWQVAQTGVIPDDYEQIRALLADWCDSNRFDLILTTGGTGFSPRDVTPEATLAIIDRQAPGLAEAMRAESMRVTPHAMLSRAAAGIRGQTLIINFPGSPKAAQENFRFVLPVLPHAVELLHDYRGAEGSHHRLDRV